MPWARCAQTWRPQSGLQRRGAVARTLSLKAGVRARRDRRGGCLGKAVGLAGLGDDHIGIGRDRRAASSRMAPLLKRCIECQVLPLLRDSGLLAVALTDAGSGKVYSAGG